MSVKTFQIAFQRIESYVVEVAAASLDEAIELASDEADELARNTEPKDVNYDYFEEA